MGNKGSVATRYTLYTSTYDYAHVEEAKTGRRHDPYRRWDGDGVHAMYIEYRKRIFNVFH